MSPEPQRVRLYGAIHGFEVFFLFHSERREIAPAPEMFTDIMGLEKGARIGVEWHEEEAFLELNRDFQQLAIKAGLGDGAGYHKNDIRFWQHITEALRSRSFEVVPLEDKTTWLRYNRAALAVEKAKRNKPQVCEDQSDIIYHAEMCRYNERCYRMGLLTEKVHAIEREDALLRAIKEKQVRAAIVGLGHSDFWIANREAIEKEHRITFDSYATMKVRDVTDRFTTFERDSAPEPRVVNDRMGLERSLHLIEEGRLTNATPDYVGTWEFYTPSKGYFEMFVAERNGERITGTIEDCLGSATFTGTINKEGIEFVKEYDPQRCASGASSKPIRYKAARQGNEFFGHWFYGGMGSPFYLVKKPKAKPVTMATRWVYLFEKTQKQES
ncbi:hypothetical protein HZB90_01215 [archaeon]|nr:hypothetical protein [archaeon]